MMRQLALLLLVLVSANAFNKKHEVPLTAFEKFQKFARTHVLETCYDMMKSKGINKEGEKCKKVNTFIRAPLQDVIDVCKNGEPTKVEKEIMYKSYEEFDITECKVKEVGSKFPECAYEATSTKSKILIKCSEMSLPLHYHDYKADDDGLVLWP